MRMNRVVQGALATRLGQRLKEPVRGLLGKAGFSLVPRQSDHRSLARLAVDLDVTTLIDIGANQGQFAAEVRRAGFAGRMVSFEPGSAAFKSLQRNASGDPAWEVLNLAVGAGRSRATLNVSKNSVSSSLRRAMPTHLDAAPLSAVTNRETVEVVALDSLDLPDGPLAIKIDTQGFEMQVLQGARATLEQVVLLQVELSLVELYDGQSSALDVLDFLTSVGFNIFDVERGFADGDSGRLLQIDAILTRKAS